MENNETKETISARRTILVVEDVESNFLLLKAIIGKIYTLGMEGKLLRCMNNPNLILS